MTTIDGPGLPDRLLRTAFCVWIGGMVAIAFVAAPLVFGAVPERMPDKDTAARVIGPAFGRIDAVGTVVCALIVGLLVGRAQRGWRLWMIASMTVCAGVDWFYIAPKITAREEPLGVYHGIATGLWMYMILAGCWMIAVGVTRADAAQSGRPQRTHAAQ